MPVIANNINEIRIKVETKEAFKLVGVKNNILIKDIEEKTIKNKKLLLITCNLLTTYMKDQNNPLSQFLVSEDILYTADEKERKAILDEWSKNKKLPKKYKDIIIQGLNTVCMYDMQFFTNRMRFPPCTGYSINIQSDGRSKKKAKSKKK